MTALSTGCEVRYVEGGHVSAHVLRQTEYRDALVDAMKRVWSKITRRLRQIYCYIFTRYALSSTLTHSHRFCLYATVILSLICNIFCMLKISRQKYNKILEHNNNNNNSSLLYYTAYYYIITIIIISKRGKGLYTFHRRNSCQKSKGENFY